ncbi:MAG: DUF5615 family PIN-like protein [Acidimicrobiales bacterium]
MKLLIEANLSPRAAAELRQHHFDDTHVVDLGLATASDFEIFDRAVQDHYVVVTSDSDFPMLLALRRASNPSVIHLRALCRHSSFFSIATAGMVGSVTTDDEESEP